jgi:hypothetical protein
MSFSRVDERLPVSRLKWRYTRNMIERWIPILGFEGCYEVSSLGRVRSLGRVNGTGYFRKGAVLKIFFGPDGYGRLVLMQNGIRRSVAVHEIVLEAFFGPRPNGMVTRHLDGDRSNNVPSNLLWGTHAENEADKIRHGTLLRGARHPRAKLSASQVSAIRALHSRGLTHREIAERFPVGRSQIANIVCGLSWIPLLP